MILTSLLYFLVLFFVYLKPKYGVRSLWFNNHIERITGQNDPDLAIIFTCIIFWELKKTMFMVLFLLSDIVIPCDVPGCTKCISVQMCIGDDLHLYLVKLHFAVLYVLFLRFKRFMFY